MTLWFEVENVHVREQLSSPLWVPEFLADPSVVSRKINSCFFYTLKASTVLIHIYFRRLHMSEIEEEEYLWFILVEESSSDVPRSLISS